MSVSRSVSEIFRVKEWRDFEKWGRGRSRSLEMAPFDRPYFIGPPLYISNYLVPFLRYLTLKNIVTLKSGLEITEGHSKFQTGTIRKIGCGFLFAFHSNYGRIFNRL